MIVYSLLAATLLFSFWSLWILWKNSARPLAASWLPLLVATGLAVVMYLYGTWVFISVYSKYVFALCFVAMLVFSLVRKKEQGAGNRTPSNNILNGVLPVVFLTLTILYFTGTAGKPYGVANLALPFKSGTYFVFQGGNGLPTNVFHYGGRRTLFAMDIIKLNNAGNRARHIFSKRLEDYEIFNDTIYSPCAGVVAKSESDNPDNIPPSRKRGPTNLNMVLIETDAEWVFLGHMKQGSVFVKKGDMVATGQPLGLAGNSGASLEPHLHIQAHAKTSRDIPWYQQPQLQIRFDGRSYLLFEEIQAR